MVDYDEIREGRRRDWWKRREAEKKARDRKSPVDEMKMLIQEANEDPGRSKRRKHLKNSVDRSQSDVPDDLGLPGPPPDPTLLNTDAPSESGKKKRRPRRQRYAEERERGLEEWNRTKRQLKILSWIAAAVIAALMLVSFILQMRAGGKEQAEMVKYMNKADREERFQDLSTPIRALGTYRSAWLRGDMQMVWDITSGAARRETLAVRTERQHVVDQLLLYNQGSLSSWVDIVRNMKVPEYLLHPEKPYQDGDLAVFRSSEYAPPEANRMAFRYVISFAYYDGKWEFFESAPETTWKETWNTVYDAKPGVSLEFGR